MLGTDLLSVVLIIFGVVLFSLMRKLTPLTKVNVQKTNVCMLLASAGIKLRCLVYGFVDLYFQS